MQKQSPWVSSHAITPLAYTNSFLFLLLFSLGVSLVVFAFERSFELVSTAAVSRDKVREFLYVLIFVLHRAIVERQGPYEFLNSERADALLFEAIVCKYFLASNADTSC